MSLVGWILGRRLGNEEQPERKIGAFEGVPAMGLDGLGSSAYGPEAALTILIPLGAAGLVYIGPIMAAIIALLVILYLSYRQTIAAYPNNGGAYIVSRENLGRNASLLAAAALMVDYVLNVAVGISAGVAALVSALPSLHPYILPLCLGILTLVTVVNLRGTLDAGRLFALPTYIFVASFVLILAIGVWKTVVSGGQPALVIPPPPLSAVAGAASIWLPLHCFASGCTAMTGVEAVSNGMSAFKEPRLNYGRRTLAAICAILGEFTDRTIAVLLPEMVKTSWWQFLLHTHRARRLHRKLLRFGGTKLVIISMPWYLEEPRIEEGMIEEAADTRTADAESGSNILKLSSRFRKAP
jgi:amino acid transporter